MWTKNPFGTGDHHILVPAFNLLGWFLLPLCKLPFLHVSAGFGKANHHVLLPHTGVSGASIAAETRGKKHEEHNICNSGLQAQQIWWNYWYQYIIIQPAHKANETNNPTKNHSLTRLIYFAIPSPYLFFWSSWGHAPSWQSCLVHGWRRSQTNRWKHRNSIERWFLAGSAFGWVILLRRGLTLGWSKIAFPKWESKALNEACKYMKWLFGFWFQICF